MAIEQTEIIRCDKCAATITDTATHVAMYVTRGNAGQVRRDFCGTCATAQTLTALLDAADAGA
jgi:hypothetical protein